MPNKKEGPVERIFLKAEKELAGQPSDSSLSYVNESAGYIIMLSYSEGPARVSFQQIKRGRDGRYELDHTYDIIPTPVIGTDGQLELCHQVYLQTPHRNRTTLIEKPNFMANKYLQRMNQAKLV